MSNLFEIEALDNGLFKNVYLIDTKILDISTRCQKLKFCDEFNHAIELLNYLGHIAMHSQAVQQHWHKTRLLIARRLGRYCF